MISLKLTLQVSIVIAGCCSAIDLVVHKSGGNITTSTMYGIMHEDINNSGDGGIYAELIRNRAFQGSRQYPSNLDGWVAFNGTQLSLERLSKPLSAALPYSMKVAAGSLTEPVGFANVGYWGISVKTQRYTGSFYVRGEYSGLFTASLQSNLTGEVFGSTRINSRSTPNTWVRHEFTITPTKGAPNSNNTFSISFDASGTRGGSLDFNLISLFPPTYNNRPNGMRPDLMEALIELRPTFFRLPGGNMLEGNNIKTFWKWNETIGPLVDRPGMAGVWGYQQTNGLGLVEYMQWAEDLACEPVLAVWDGLALDGNYLDQADLGQYVQYALDEIEFLTGDASTTWGRKRIELGYPTPWTIKYVEIGNEDWLAGAPAAYNAYKQYRFRAFLDAFTKTYPHIKVVASPSIFDNMTIPAYAAGDYHNYATPDSMVEQFNKFDHLTIGNLTLIGETATVHPNGGTGWAGNLLPLPWWGGSVGEAVFLIGAERNSDRLIGATYAPMARSLDRWAWSATLLQFAADPALTTRSTSWYVWQLLGRKTLSKTLPVTSNGRFGPLYYVAGSSSTGSIIFKAAVYNSTGAIPVSLQVGSVGEGAKAELTVLTGPADPYSMNDPQTGVNVVRSHTSTLRADDKGAFHFSLPSLSVAVLETDNTGHR